ncbi:uncharacterized protein BDV17DRAFT_298302 [Aspergillus undulatus]|uniref:uncharacterized protein n=1 Tax=Aspergillus undulatus TaxID=1810928 RepID=UPI003CCD1934
MSWKHTPLQALFATGVFGFGSSVAHPNKHARSEKTEKIAWGPCGDVPGADAGRAQCGNLTVPLDYTSPNLTATTPKKGSILFNLGGPAGTGNTLTANLIVDQEDTAVLGKLWGVGKVVSNACYDYPGLRKNGSMLSTAFTARGLIHIVDAVQDDGLLRFWGVSYGTVLGATVAAVFADRVDGMVLDAVLNPHLYFNGHIIERWAAADKAFSAFIKECLKVPDRCGFSHRNRSAEEIEEDIYALLDNLEIEPLVDGTTVIDHSAPHQYSNMVRALDGLLSSPPEITLDKQAPQQTFEELGEVFEALEGGSRLLGSIGKTAAAACANWRVPAKERHEDDFNVATRHPTFIIENTYDLATPFASAQNLSATLPGALLHASDKQVSSCTVQIIRDYVSKWTPPDSYKYCETDFGPFDNSTFEDLLHAPCPEHTQSNTLVFFRVCSPLDIMPRVEMDITQSAVRKLFPFTAIVAQVVQP